MDSQEFILIVAFPHLFAQLLLAFHSATLLFLGLYIALLIRSARPLGDEVPASRLPIWLGFMYPAWLDRLTIKDIVKSFAVALCVAVAALPLLMMAFLLLIMRSLAP
jgi:hypothetical protein